MYAKLISQAKVSIYTNNDMLICTFEGPMAKSAAVTFIKALEKENNLPPMMLEEYLKD